MQIIFSHFKLFLNNYSNPPRTLRNQLFHNPSLTEPNTKNSIGAKRRMRHPNFPNYESSPAPHASLPLLSFRTPSQIDLQLPPCFLSGMFEKVSTFYSFPFFFIFPRTDYRNTKPPLAVFEFGI